METSGFAQISLVAQNILCCPNFGVAGASPPPRPVRLWIGQAKHCEKIARFPFYYPAAANTVTCLGSIVSKKGGTDEDIQARIGKARKAFAMLRPIWRFTALTTKIKLRVFGSNVKAVLLYDSETWRLKLQLFINKSLRNILRIWWPRKISNKELWRQTGQRPTEQEIRQRAWGWIGHTLRRPDGHVVKRALEWNPQGKRKRGRPQHTW